MILANTTSYKLISSSFDDEIGTFYYEWQDIEINYLTVTIQFGFVENRNKMIVVTKNILNLNSLDYSQYILTMYQYENLNNKFFVDCRELPEELFSLLRYTLLNVDLKCSNFINYCLNHSDLKIALSYAYYKDIEFLIN